MMDIHDEHHLWYPAYKVLNEGPQLTSTIVLGRMLDEALGITEFEDYIHRLAAQDRPMPDGPLKDLLKALGGPYGKAILKAYRIKRGLE